MLSILLISLIFNAISTLYAQDPDDYFVGHGFVGNGDTVFTNSGTFWDDGYTGDYSATGDWDVYFCTPQGNPNPLTLEFKGFATHYGGGWPAGPGEWFSWDYLHIRYEPVANYYAYNDDTPEFAFTSQDGCIRFTMTKNNDAFTHAGWEAEIYAIPPPPNNGPCGAALLPVGSVCTPQVFTNKGAYPTGTYATPCHNFFGGDVWFSAVVPPSGNMKIESFPGTLEWAVMNLYTGSSCSGLTHYACIEDSIGMPTAVLTGMTPGDTLFIRMFGDQAKSGTFGMCASDPFAQIKGHTGPGGVGDDSTNMIWFRADRGVLNNSDAEASDGEAVKTWMDQSGNSNDVMQTTGIQQSLLADAVINGRPVLRFDGNNDYMNAELSSLSAPLTLLAVGRFTASGADDHLMSMGDEVNPAKTVSISRESDDRYYAFTDNAKWYGPALSDDTPYLIHAGHNIGAPRHELFLNGTAQSPADYSTSVITDGSLCLGASRSLGNFLGGDIAEFIIYRQRLNDAQKIIVENFLAAKYGIAIAGDRYEWESAHGYDVAGIGQVDINNRHTEAQSDATLSIGNPTDLDDGEFVLFGHDNGDISSWTTTERPNDDPNLQRIAREWRVDISGGDPGLLTLTLNDSLLPDQIPGYNNYILWTDTDGDFSSGATAVPIAKVDGEFVANTVALSDGIYITVAAVMPVVGFGADSSAGPESLANPDVEVRLNYAVNEEVSVVFRAIDGTAAGGGVDYLLNPGSATFPAGATTAIIQPLIIDDTIVEPDKDFYIRLSDPDPGLILSADSNHTYTIRNDDILVIAETDTDTIGECGLVSAHLSSTVSGTGPFSYAWTPAAGLSNDSIPDPVATPSADTWYTLKVTDQTNGAVGTDSVYITVLPRPGKPLITPAGSTSLCEGDSLLLSASPGYAWLWSTGETTQDIHVSAPGNYTVRGIDVFGCQSDPSDAVTVTVNPVPAMPVITASGDTDICPGDSVDLTSSLGDQYLWSTSQTTRTIRVKTAGDYYVQVRSPEGCWSDTSLHTTVTLKTPPSAPAITPSGPTSFCPGDSVDLTASEGDTWLWSTGETSQTIRVKTPGSYTVQVTDSTTCLSDPSDATVVAFHPVPAAPSITPGGSTDICETDSVSLTSSAGSSWLWSSGQTTQVIYAKADGDYTVQVSNAQGCWSPPSAATTITTNPAPAKPTISYSGSTDLCQGDSLVLNSSPGDAYLWSGGETTPGITVKTAGSYWVRVSDAAGCYSPPSDPVNVNVNPLPEKPLISGDTRYCAGDSAQLSAPASSGYLWSTGDTSASIFITSGSYTLRITDANGCVSPTSDPHDVSEDPLPPKPEISGNDSYCEGDSTLLSSPAASSYAWSTGETIQSIQVKTPGSYTLVVGDANGCLSPVSEPFSVTELPKPPKPVIYADGPLEFWMGDSVKLSTDAAAAYLWSPGGETSPEIIARSSGDYTVTISDANGCTSDPSDPATVNVLTLGKPVITINGATEFCEGNPATILSTSEASAYEWSTGESTRSISVSTSGSYTVRVYNAAGYPSELSDPVTISVYPNPILSLAARTDVACYGESTGTAEVTVSGGTPPYAYTWTNGQTGTQATGLSAGLHTVTVSDANQCWDTVRMEIRQPEALLIQESITQPYCSESYNGSIEISISGGTPSYSILWSDGSGNALLEDLGPGTYDVQVSDANQCTAEESYTLTYTQENCITAYEIITPNDDGYNDTWRIRGIEYYPQATVEIYDRWGKRVFYSRGYDQPWDGRYEGELLPMASYHYVINLNNGSPPLVGNITIVK